MLDNSDHLQIHVL